jgi:hypothetical protein
LDSWQKYLSIWNTIFLSFISGSSKFSSHTRLLIEDATKIWHSSDLVTVSDNGKLDTNTVFFDDLTIFGDSFTISESNKFNE